MTSISSNSPAATPPARKWDAEIITARQQDQWLTFEAGIHQNDTLRARVARSLDRFGLGTSTATVDEALDYLINKELGQSARYFNQTGKPQFNQQQITHAVLSFMAIKEQQRLPFAQQIVDKEIGFGEVANVKLVNNKGQERRIFSFTPFAISP